ncbi:hypothetical protein V8F06_007021 [Rhypophila decipiens]
MADHFDICKDRVTSILNGTLVFNGISNTTIHSLGYLYNGPIGGLRPEYLTYWHENFVTITTAGCKAICQDPVDWYWTSDPSLTLGIVSNWILPIIALLAALPFDGGAKKARARDTARAVWNWLGSPQTALTATFFNIHQMRICLRAANAERQENKKEVARDAYYVLSCIGQFELPTTDLGMDCFLHGVVYGLFRPLAERSGTDEDMPHHTRQAERWTQDLLRAMARQMRRSRRLGIYSTLASIFLFFVAYAASVVLAFAEGLGERTTTHSLAFGILITWLPLLLLFSILDRNPNSADRTRDFCHRWLWNVRAVREWERGMEKDPRREDLAEPYWWTKAREKEWYATRRQEQLGCDARRQCHHELGTFIGQGRKMGYYNLALSVVDAVRKSKGKDSESELASWASDQEANAAAGYYSTLVDKTRDNLNTRPPLAWRLLALAALAMVWWELGMALMISYNIPTVGIGCRSGSYLVYGGLSTVPWLAYVYRHLVLGRSWDMSQAKRGWLSTLRLVGEWFGMFLDGLSAFCMLTSLPCLSFITFAAFSGILKNCTCRGGVNQYIDFESASLYSNPEIFNVRVWWIVAAVTAAIPVVMSFVVAVPMLIFKLQALWQEEQEQEQEQEHADEEGTPILGADMEWVAR